MSTSTRLSNKEQRLVVGEIRDWLAAQLISAEQAELLSARYPGHAQKGNITGVVSLIGAVLVGLGTLLFIGANWQHIAVGAKLLLIAAAIGTSYYFGWRLRYEPGTRPKLGSALLLLGGLFYGAGIWLVAQIFNLDANFSEGLLLWAAGTAGTALVTRSVPLGCLTSVLLGMWTFARVDFNSFEHSAQFLPNFCYFMLAFTGMLGLGGFLRSRAVTWITLAFSAVWMLVICPLHQNGLLVWAQGLFGCYLWVRRHWTIFSAPFLYMSSVSTFGALLGSTFGWETNWDPGSIGILALLMFCTLATLMLVAWRDNETMLEVVGCIGIVLLGVVIGGATEGGFRVLSNTLLLSAIGGAIYTGMNRLRSPGLVNVALVFFVFDVIARYFDFFFSMMDRSVFFIVGGVVLMAVGAAAEGGRRKLLETLEPKAA